MKRRISILAVILVFVGVLIYLSSRYIAPKLIARTSPTQTSIYAGTVDPELINQLRATQPNGEISKEQAIGLAELYCASVHSWPTQSNPTNIEAYHLTEKEATRRLKTDQPSTSTAPVWLVSMDGLWEHFGPGAALGTEATPLFFTHCNVIINAVTADMMVLTN